MQASPPVTGRLRDPRSLVDSIAEVWRYRELLRHLVARELKVKYKRSVLGWLWSLANPLLIAAVFTLIFSIIARVTPPPGDPSGIHTYSLFLLCALLSWNFTSNVLSLSTAAIVGNADLVRKVYFPKAILVLTHVIASLVTFLLELAVLLTLILIVGGKPWVGLPALPAIVLLQAVFAGGLGLLVGALNVYFRDVQHLIGILLMIWFYGTPIIYPPGLVPDRIMIAGFDVPIGGIMALNPMAAFVEVYRDIFYHGRMPSIETFAFLSAVSVAVLAACFMVFKSLEPRFAEET